MYIWKKEQFVSSLDRIKVGRSLSHDFRIKLQSTLKLYKDMKHELAVDQVMMTYSWHNINSQYKNNKIKYNGTAWKTITFVDGMYSYGDINDHIREFLEK